jgi:hypothetical protein
MEEVLDMTLADKIGYWPSMIAMVFFVAGIGCVIWKQKKGKWPWEK